MSKKAISGGEEGRRRKIGEIFGEGKYLVGRVEEEERRKNISGEGKGKHLACGEEEQRRIKGGKY